MKFSNICLIVSLFSLLFVQCKKEEEKKAVLPEECNHVLYLGFATLPNAFTPNGDGRNDAYHIVALPSVLSQLFEYKLSVLTLGGTLLFETNSPSSVWDGRDLNGNAATDLQYHVTIRFKYMGNLTDECTYVYLLPTTNGHVHLSGLDPNKLLFEDMIDPATGAAVYPTTETVEP